MATLCNIVYLQNLKSDRYQLYIDLLSLRNKWVARSPGQPEIASGQPDNSSLTPDRASRKKEKILDLDIYKERKALTKEERKY